MSAPAPRRAVLLVNVGTPDAPTVPAVRRYLAEFLGDPRVVDLPGWARWLLLYLVILPFRPRRSAHAYQQVWTEQGSPLLLHSRRQAEELQSLLPGRQVVLAMRYGHPSLGDALARLREQGVEDLVVIPLYPQHASATTGTTEERVAELWQGPGLTVVPAFHGAGGFLRACAERVQEAAASIQAEHVLFSYHGVPLRQLKGFCPAPCGSGACPPLGPDNARCYRAQCFATSGAVAAAANLPSHSTSFQSRLKGTTWTGPFTEDVLGELAQRGVRRLAVACPSFVADCLETLEEIGQRGQEAFRAAGGTHFVLVPAVNAHPDFIQCLADEARRASP